MLNTHFLLDRDLLLPLPKFKLLVLFIFCRIKTFDEPTLSSSRFEVVETVFVLSDGIDPLTSFAEL